jgi:hypothetical protein
VNGTLVFHVDETAYLSTGSINLRGGARPGATCGIAPVQQQNYNEHTLNFRATNMKT